MGENSAISWTDHTFNPWVGCTKVSPACDGCYAEAMMDKRYGRVQWGKPGQGNGTRERTSAGNWSKPRAWDRKAAAAGTRPFVFCSSLADVFDNQVPVQWRRDLFDLIRATPNLVWLLLTKRPQNIVKMYEEAQRLNEDGTRWTSSLPWDRKAWPRNAAIGTTVEDQERAINLFRLARAARETNPLFTFGSFEPLLGRVDPTRIAVADDEFNALTGELISRLSGCVVDELEPLDWVITGGETDQGGHKARPSHPDWYRSIRDQCAVAGVAYHHKQNGEWAPTIGLASTHWIDRDGNTCEAGSKPYTGDLSGIAKLGKSRAGRLLDGVEHNARPEVRAA